VGGILEKRTSVPTIALFMVGIGERSTVTNILGFVMGFYDIFMRCSVLEFTGLCLLYGRNMIDWIRKMV